MEIETQSQINTFHCQSTELMLKKWKCVCMSCCVQVWSRAALQVSIQICCMSPNIDKQQQFLDAVVPVHKLCDRLRAHTHMNIPAGNERQTHQTQYLYRQLSVLLLLLFFLNANSHLKAISFICLFIYSLLCCFHCCCCCLSHYSHVLCLYVFYFIMIIFSFCRWVPG